ncbi:MAG: efflux RND transporter permease subunit [Myxococcales bacterium]|jgi:HAE1 family hydrophobic/amphiphilic exporter-1
MNLSELSVRRPVTGVMVFLCLTILGLFTFSRLKLDMLPDIEFPIVAVITQYPGAGPESIERLVTEPIEEAMASVENVEDVFSESNQNISMVMVKFGWGTDMDQAEQDVRKNLEIFALDRLPDDVPRPLTFAFDPSMQPVVFLSVRAPGNSQVVRKLAEDEVEPYLSRIPGVASADVLGGTEREIQVRLRPEWLEAYKIPVQQVVGALRGANVMIPGGNLSQGRQELNLSTSAEFTSVQQVREVMVGQAGGRPVYLRDVADVLDTFEEQVTMVRANDVEAVMIAVRKQSDANTVQVANRVLAEIDKLQEQLPEGTAVTPLFDQAEPIELSIANLSSSAMLAIFITAAILLAFLRSWRTSSIVLVSIPLSLLATFAVMDFSSVTLNIISMAGLALAVGMLVDNSIVVLENIFGHLERGEDRKTAAIKGTTEVAMPITASTLTTVVVFAPILFVPGIAGQIFKDMSLTIVISLTASLLVALTLVPLLASLMVNHKRNWFERAIAFLTFWVDPLADLYARILRVCLRNKGKVLLGAVLVFAGAIALIPIIGIDFMPKTDAGQISVTIKAAPGTSLWTTDEIFREVENIVKQEVPEAQVVTAQFGAGEGLAALSGQSSYSGSVRVRLPSRRQRERSQFEIEAVLRERFEEIPGAEIRVVSQGMSSDGDVAVKIFTDDLDQLAEYGSLLKSKLETVEGAADITFSREQGRPELKIELDRDQIKLLGMAPAEVATTISTYFLGTTATMYREDGDEYDVLVRAPRDVREDLARLRALPVVTPRGVVPLETVAKIDSSLGPTAVSRENKRRRGTVNVTADNVALGTLIERVEKAVDELGPVEGVSTMIAGSAEDLQESFQGLFWALLVAVVLVYIVMASQFESLLEPFVIILAVPLAFSGAIFALGLTGTTLQVTALIGMVLLAGVVVNNGIVLIDVVKNRRYEGADLVEATMEAGRSRLRPILMTTLTTIFGMVPLAFEWGDGSELWAPMARAVIGGMMLSTALTLIVVPNLYVTLAGYADRRKARKLARLQTEAAAEIEPEGSGA